MASPLSSTHSPTIYHGKRIAFMGGAALQSGMDLENDFFLHVQSILPLQWEHLIHFLFGRGLGKWRNREEPMSDCVFQGTSPDSPLLDCVSMVTILTHLCWTVSSMVTALTYLPFLLLNLVLASGFSVMPETVWQCYSSMPPGTIINKFLIAFPNLPDVCLFLPCLTQRILDAFFFFFLASRLQKKELSQMLLFELKKRQEK